jgi:hypothetical protein
MKKKSRAQRAAKAARNAWSREVAVRAVANKETAEHGYRTHFRGVKKVARYHPELLPNWMHIEAEAMLKDIVSATTITQENPNEE